jgi:hypothetical protein
MGAHHHIDRSPASPAGCGGFLFGHKARQAADLKREAVETLGKTLVMLAGEQCGGRDHHHLHPGHRRDEGRAQAPLGLAEADIAADQAVHRRPEAMSPSTSSIAAS